MGTEESKDPESVEEVHERYSLFTLNEKRCITAMAAYAASFSTLSGFIYYPALPQLAETLSVSIDDINLTVTTYMAVATVAPTLMGDTADVLGRRPIYVIALSLYIATNIATALAKSYIALLVLRLFQGLAISGSSTMKLTCVGRFVLTFSLRYLCYCIRCHYRYCNTGRERILRCSCIFCVCPSTDCLIALLNLFYQINNGT